MDLAQKISWALIYFSSFFKLFRVFGILVFDSVSVSFYVGYPNVRCIISYHFLFLVNCCIEVKRDVSSFRNKKCFERASACSCVNIVGNAVVCIYRHNRCKINLMDEIK